MGASATFVHRSTDNDIAAYRACRIRQQGNVFGSEREGEREKERESLAVKSLREACARTDDCVRARTGDVPTCPGLTTS